MAKAEKRGSAQIDRFFVGPGARGDQWHDLAELAERWAHGSADRASFEAALSEMSATEEFHAYPGARLITALRGRAAANDPGATASLARRITRALLTRSFRQSTGDWTEDEDDDATTSDVMPPSLSRADARRPYFEVLIVTGAPATRWAALGAEWRRLRRPLDDFVYETVFVGSFDVATIKPLVERYLGSLPSINRKETARDVGIRPPTAVVDKLVTKGATPKSQVGVVFSGPFANNPKNRLVIKTMANTLAGNLQRVLREDLGGTYGVSVVPDFTKRPVEEYRVSITFACDPARTQDLVKALFTVVEDFKTDGPSPGQVADAGGVESRCGH